MTQTVTHCKEEHPLEGHGTRIGDFGDEVFYLTYAGFDDQWLVKKITGEEMLRCGAEELPSFLVHDPVAFLEERFNCADANVNEAQRVVQQAQEVKFIAEQALILARARVEAKKALCECYLECEADSDSGRWHTHEDEPCLVHPDAPMVGV